MKAGLVTFYHIHHYGALLQAAATERAVERFGWDCEIIDYFVNQDNALFKRVIEHGDFLDMFNSAINIDKIQSVEVVGKLSGATLEADAD